MSCNEVYDSLPQFDIASDIEKVRNENEILHQRIVQLEEEVNNLSKTIVNLKKIQQNLATNISELYKTALCEINRKNQIINDLRSQLDDLIFKRQNNYNSNHNHDKVMKFYENKRSRSPSIDSRSSKKFKIERSNSKDCDRYRYKISPRKLIRRNVEKTHHRHGDRESSKDLRTSRDRQRSTHEEKEQDKTLTQRCDAVTDNKKDRLEDRQQNDDNFLKTANSKGNIYKKDLFQDQNLSVNNNNNTKRSEKRKIDVVTKKLFDKAEQVAEKDDEKSKEHKKNIGNDKAFNVNKSQNHKEKSTKEQTQIVENNSASMNVKSDIKIVRQIFNEAILNNKTMLQLSENGKYKTLPIKTTDRIIENTKIDNKSDKIPANKEKIKHKKDKKVDKSSDRKSVDKKINKKSVDRKTGTINKDADTKIIDEIVKSKKEEIFEVVEKNKMSDEVPNNETKSEEIPKESTESKKQNGSVDKSPIKEKISDKTPVHETIVEEIDKISKESYMESKKHDEVVDKLPTKGKISDKTRVNETKVEAIENISKKSCIESKKHNEIVDKSPNKGEISDKTVTNEAKVEVIKISEENKDKKTISKKTQNDKINGISNEAITERETIEKSLEDKINEMFNSPLRNDVKSIENEQLSTNLNEINEYSIKECVVQLNSNDIVDIKDDNVDNTKSNEFKTPLKDTNIINTSRRILRSAKKKIFNMECVEEETTTIKPSVSTVKTTKLKRGRPRKNPTIQQANIEVINEDNIPVLHIIESPIELTNTVELTPPSIDNSTIVTPQSIEDNSKLSITNCLNSSTDSNRSVKKQRRRCVIKMID